MWAVVVAVVVALTPAALLSAHRLLASPAPSASPTTDLPIPPVSSTPPPAGPTASPTARATTHVKLPHIGPDAPRRISAGTLVDSGFDDAVDTLEPASTTEVARWKPRGSPGSPGSDTVYVVGKVLGTDSAFAGLPRLTAGRKISIRTDAGTLTYTVTATTLALADGLAQQPLFTRHKPGRLVLVGIRYDGSGDRLAKALVVTAQLSAARPS